MVRDVAPAGTSILFSPSPADIHGAVAGRRSLGRPPAGGERLAHGGADAAGAGELAVGGAVACVVGNGDPHCPAAGIREADEVVGLRTAHAAAEDLLAVEAPRLPAELRGQPGQVARQRPPSRQDPADLPLRHVAAGVRAHQRRAGRPLRDQARPAVHASRLSWYPWNLPGISRRAGRARPPGRRRGLAAGPARWPSSLTPAKLPATTATTTAATASGPYQPDSRRRGETCSRERSRSPARGASSSWLAIVRLSSSSNALMSGPPRHWPSRPAAAWRRAPARQAAHARLPAAEQGRDLVIGHALVVAQH